jgi:phosphoribosylglycinamide formyltransferase-1
MQEKIAMSDAGGYLDRPLRVAVLGSGNGSNCQSILDAIDAGTLNATMVCVLSDVENAFILERACAAGVPAHFVSAAPYRNKLAGDAEKTYLATLANYRPDILALAGFMRIIKGGLLQAYPNRIINIHPSLLPAFPGLEAWQQALEYGVKVTGCTVHIVDAGTDTGPILIQRTVPVMDDDTPESLHARIQREEHEAYPAALRGVCRGIFPRICVDA